MLLRCFVNGKLSDIIIIFHLINIENGALIVELGELINFHKY